VGSGYSQSTALSSDAGGTCASAWLLSVSPLLRIPKRLRGGQGLKNWRLAGRFFVKTGKSENQQNWSDLAWTFWNLGNFVTKYVKKTTLMNFGEEAIRNQPFFDLPKKWRL
jgi:hypothetical protein